MEIKQCNATGLFYRPNTSDYKSIKEVILKKGYERRNFKLGVTDKWLDIGGCIGAFSYLASKNCASVEVFEPYSVHVDLLHKNLDQYNNVTIHPFGLSTKVSDEKLHLNTAQGNTWRNSIHKEWRGGTTEIVHIKHIKDYVDNCNAIKLDAEGVEKEILNWLMDNGKIVNKLVFEWSFDIHKETKDFFTILTKLKQHYDIYGVTDNYVEKLKPHKQYPPSWFPPCVTVFCVKK